MAGAAVVVLAVAVAGAQQEVPRFKSGVDVVQFTVTVLDKDRRPITGLTASDFQVLVDGKPRPLAAFAAVTLPNETAAPVAVAAPSVASDIHTNQLPPEGRLVVIVMDRSTPNGQPMQAARGVANAAIDRLGPSDLGAVVFTAAGSRKYSQGFTSERRRLHAAVEQALLGALEEPQTGIPVAQGMDKGTVQQASDTGTGAGGRGAPPLAPSGGRTGRVQLASEEESGECMCGVCVLDSLAALTKTLAGGMVRHKSILFVGSDIAVASQKPTSKCAAYIQPARERLSRALDEANVTFNVVDPRGLEPLAETAESAGPVGRADWGPNLFRQSDLATFPDYTGGRVVMNTNKPADKIPALFDESRAYYVLAVARDGATGAGDDRHQVKITVKRSDAIVRTRALYFGGDDGVRRKGAATPAAAALAELLPRGDFPLQMNLVPQFLPDGSAEIRVLLGVASEVSGKLDVLIGAFDRMFKPAGDPLKQRLDVPAAAVAGTAAFQWATVLKPPPGDYEVRAAVATADGKRAASVIGYADVPDVRNAGLALSGILVKSGGAATLRRTFAAGESVGLAFQIARAKEVRDDVSVRYVLSDETGQALTSAAIPPPEGAGDTVGSREITIRMPDVSGSYIATIEASSGSRVVRRQLTVIVR